MRYERTKSNYLTSSYYYYYTTTQVLGILPSLKRVPVDQESRDKGSAKGDEQDKEFNELGRTPRTWAYSFIFNLTWCRVNLASSNPFQCLL